MICENADCDEDVVLGFVASCCCCSFRELNDSASLVDTESGDTSDTRSGGELSMSMTNTGAGRGTSPEICRGTSDVGSSDLGGAFCFSFLLLMYRSIFR